MVKKKYNLLLVFICVLLFFLISCNKNYQKDMAYRLSKNTFFSDINWAENQDISFHKVIDDKLLYSIYEIDGSDTFTTKGLYYLDLKTNKHNLIKENDIGRIWDFVYEDDTLIYSKVERDYVNYKDLFLVSVFLENKDGSKLINKGHTFNPQRTPSFKKVNAEYCYILEDIVRNSNEKDNIEEWHTTFNSIDTNNSNNTIIYENTSTIDKMAISYDKWILSSPDFEAYDDVAIFLSKQNKNNILSIYKNNKITIKIFDEIIAKAWFLNEDDILLKIVKNNTAGTEPATIEYKLYNISMGELKEADIKGDLARISNISENKLIGIDNESNASQIISYINGEIYTETLYEIDKKMSYYIPVNNDLIYIYQYELINDQFINSLNELNLKN